METNGAINMSKSDAAIDIMRRVPLRVAFKYMFNYPQVYRLKAVPLPGNALNMREKLSNEAYHL